jgi:hypothetical protein
VSSARYSIFATLRGFSDNSGYAKLLASGKLNSASTSAMSEVIVAPEAPKGMELMLLIGGRFDNEAAKTGANSSYFAIFPSTGTPSFGTPNVARETTPLLVLDSPNSPQIFRLAISPGDRFAILDTGFAV